MIALSRLPSQTYNKDAKCKYHPCNYLNFGQVFGRCLLNLSPEGRYLDRSVVDLDGLVFFVLVDGLDSYIGNGVVLLELVLESDLVLGVRLLQDLSQGQYCVFLGILHVSEVG